MRPFALFILLVALLASAGCSTERKPGDLLAPGELGEIVVDGTLIVGQPVSRVLLRKTLSPADPYDPAAAAVSGAVVRIVEVGGAGIPLAETSAGRYESPSPPPLVKPRTEYRLEVQTADGRTVTASTVTPDTFHVDDWVLLDQASLAIRRSLAVASDFPVDPDSVYVVDSNQLVYQDGLLEARFARGGEIAFQVGLHSLDPGSPYVIDADFLSEEDLADLKRDSSSPPLVSEQNAIRLPWFAIFFEGRYRIQIISIDRNWFDLSRSLPEFGGSNGGFGGNAGDNFERPIFHVQGGIGLFASGSTAEIGFNILPGP